MAKRGTSLQYGFSWDDVVYIPLTTAQDRFKGTHYVNYLNVRAVDTDSIEKATEEVKSVLRKRHRGQDNFLILVLRLLLSKNWIKSAESSKSC